MLFEFRKEKPLDFAVPPIDLLKSPKAFNEHPSQNAQEARPVRRREHFFWPFTVVATTARTTLCGLSGFQRSCKNTYNSFV